MSNKNDFKPEIRFKEFTNDWVLKRINEIGYKFSGLTGLTKDNFVGGKSIYISYLDVYKNNIIDFLPDNYVNIHNHQNKIKIGDILVPTSSETINESGMASVFNFETSENVYLNSFCFGVRPYDVESIVPNFLGFLMRSKNIRKEIIKLSQGISRYNLNVNNFLSLQINIPNDKNEMKKIASLIDEIRQSITLLQRKLKKLENIKEFLLNKMFVSGQANFPEIRFKEFTNAWVLKPVDEIATVKTGSSNTDDATHNGIYPFFIRSEDVKKSNKYIFDKEAVITIGDGKIGSVFHYVNGKFDLHQRCYGIFDFNYVSGKYFYWYFSSHFLERALSQSAKNTVDSVRMEMITKMDIQYPNVEKEQNKITLFFDNIDSSITLLQRKLEKLENIKSTLLNKMFI
ncbi:restriction endonuclease subunit S [Mycoplasma sp. OR1901]|uniref:restriction endonuclease subunit S n=1 Tax=Mycoplasma sp. OR1901 TaxID=2742195 RepID=UPI0015836453|nr:restriction endonuclease subunit S [Mycoplasma sp. OR1901]QKT05675.1 restriction endonuclease subunit S [Mycoplasma sp. OR1901]